MFYLQLTYGLEMEKVAEVVSVTFFYAPTSPYFLFESDKLKSRDFTLSNNDNIATPSIDSSINLTNLTIVISLPHDTLKVSLEGDLITNSITLDNNDIGTKSL